MNPELLEALDNRVAMAESNLRRARLGLFVLALVTMLVAALLVSVWVVTALAAARGYVLPAAMVYAGLAWYKLLELRARIDVARLELAEAWNDRSSFGDALALS